MSDSELKLALSHFEQDFRYLETILIQARKSY